MPIDTSGPFQNVFDVPAGRPTNRAWTYSSNEVPPSFFRFNYLASSKFLGYAVLSPPRTGSSSSKFLGYAVLFVGPLNRFQLECTNPIPKRYPTDLRSWLSSPSLSLLAGATLYGEVGEVPTYDLSNPITALQRRTDWIQSSSLTLLGSANRIRPVLFIVT